MKPNFYKQYDSRWANYTLKRCNVGRNGCGPTSIANVVSALTHKKVTPKDVFKYMVNHGYIDPVNGSYWNGITETLKHYDIKKFQVTSSQSSARKALQKGHWLIGVVTYSRWTRGGHYITLYGIKNGKVLVSDSASASDYRQKQGTWNEYARAERMQWIDINPVDYQKETIKKPKTSEIVTLYISDAKANIRKGRGEKYGVKAKLKRGTKLKLYSYKNGWYRIKSGKYKGYYISEKTLSKYKPYISVFTTLTTMNVRDGYTTNGTKVLKTINKGTKFKTSKKKGKWVYAPAYKGWICIQDSTRVYLKEKK